ncbi:hypothetical protein EV186_1011786 [Labedaea rhizosphaerae]|uniref:Uncharacterized protein n=1 Tax=Labedaea rhizosphaerae TaxID=598644 RepID=A0A4R6SNA6_LABRH|nr:hypothetical protein EV186_1011786 [Labedaea rhizosphaerae]
MIRQPTRTQDRDRFGVDHLRTLEGLVPQVIGDELIALTDSRIRWTLAHNLVRELHDCTLIEVAELC